MFSREHNTTPLKLINAEALRGAKARMDAEFSKEATENYEFVRCEVKRRIESLVENHINTHKHKVAPKYLNLRVCSVKSWLLFNGVIDSLNQFKSFKFDKSSRSTRDEALFTPDQFHAMLDAADIREKCVVGLYGIHGVRPRLIPQLKIEDIKSAKSTLSPLLSEPITHVDLAPKTWIIVKREYDGNKGNIDFPVILTTETAQWVSAHLNDRIRRGEVLTLKSQIVDAPSYKSISDVIGKVYAVVGFHGRKYLMRHYANKQLKRAVADTELKEWLMGHSGEISAVYDHTGHTLSEDEIKEYNDAVDITKLRVYGASSDELAQARTAAKLIARITGIDESVFSESLALLETGKMTYAQFDARLTETAKKAQEDAIAQKFDELMKAYQKRNGA